MPLFNFKAQKSDGSIYEGKREAADKFALYRELKASGETALLAEEASAHKKFDWKKFTTLFSRVNTHDKIIFARNLGSMLEAGLAVSRALTVMEKQAHQGGRLREVIIAVNNDIKKGVSLSQALKAFPDVFPGLMVAMVHSGEESGGVAQALKLVAFQMEKTYELKKKVQGAMMYPAIVITAMVIIAVLMMIFVVPAITNTFASLEVELPLSTRTIIFISDLIRNHLISGLVGLAAIVFGLYSLSRTKQGRQVIDWSVLKIPLIGKLVVETNTARTARTLASLVSAGVEMVEAFRIAREVVQNSYYRKVLTQAEEVIQRGSPIAGVFLEHTKLYPPFLGEMVAVGEETGKLGEMLGNVSVYYETEVERKTKDMSTIIEPFLMIIIGAAVGFFAISIISPTYSLVGSI